MDEPINAKPKGAHNEHRSMQLLEAAGYACTRAAASLGAWDVIGIGATERLAEADAQPTFAYISY